MRFAPFSRSWVVGAALLFPSAAFAQSSSSAQALFEDGRKLMIEGKFGEACPKLAASQRLDPGAGTLLNLATCYEKNGQVASAWATFKDAASSARQTGHLDWERAARERAEQLEPNLSRLTIVVPPDADVPGLVIERDGRAVDRAEWGIALPVDAGVHPIEALAPKKQKWSTTISVAPNAAQASVTIPVLALEQSENAGSQITAAPTPPVAPDDRMADPGATQRTIGLVAGGVGLVGLGVGSVLGLVAKSTHDDALTHCTPDLRCSREGIDLGDRASTQATISTVSFIAGGALLAAGAVLFLTAPKKRGPNAAFFVAPAAQRSGAIGGVGGAF